MEQKLSLDSESEYGGIKLGDQDQEVSTDTMTERGRRHRGCSRRVKATQSRVGLGRAARVLHKRRKATTDPTGEYKSDEAEEGDDGRWPLAGSLGRGREADCHGRRHRCCRLEKEVAKADDCQRKPERGRGGEEAVVATAIEEGERGCDKGRQCGYVAAVEEATTLVFWVADAVATWGRRWRRQKRLLSLYKEKRTREKYRCR
ncbi:hypothetical protein GW17_00037417 [Ensete ventricosum]|nr:hypothetical protein GW17_00037417 [Ensete ventricosum]RZR86835.1 hypothetical protein BHM03_00014116 [Ensete ventricosum]